MNIDADDVGRLAMGVRHFLRKADLLTRLTGMATLYLEFPDAGTMHHVHMSIMRAMQPHMIKVDGKTCEYLDDHTIRLEPIAGISIVLSCKQRFATTMSGSVGYRDIAFVTRDPSSSV